MIDLEDGLSLCGRCVCGMQVGFIIRITQATYRVRWLDGSETTQLRPDLEPENDELLEAAE